MEHVTSRVGGKLWMLAGRKTGLFSKPLMEIALSDKTVPEELLFLVVKKYVFAGLGKPEILPGVFLDIEVVVPVGAYRGP